jgi:ABC-2 type transport system ATP-binding protein
LLSSHILTELRDVCTSIGIIEHGQMVVSGPINEIADRLAAQQLAHGHGWPAGTAAPSVAPQRHGLKLRVLGDPRAAAHALSGLPGILEVNPLGGGVHVSFEGGDVRVAEIVALLVARGIGVIGVEQERNELERIFLEATRRSERRQP